MCRVAFTTRRRMVPGARPMFVCERRITVWVVFIFLLLTYVLNNLWYVSNFVLQVPRRPSPNSLMWRAGPGSPYNMSLLNNTPDFTTLVDRTDFRFLINTRRCDGVRNLFLLVFVHSAPANFRKRQAIRRTWGREQNLVEDSMRVVFLVGEVNNAEVLNNIRRESDRYADIIQGNFVDSYRNLTYKHIMGLKWVTYYCRQARYVFKTDDDIFVDVFQLVDYLKGSFGDPSPRNLMMCFLIRNPYVKRSQRSKWRVTFQEYPGKYYPPYCSGWGIIMSPDVVFNLYLQSSRVPYFWVDDVHVSGTLAQRVGITHVDFTSKLALTEKDIRRWLEDKDIARPHLFGHPDSDVATIYALWNKTTKYYEWARAYRWRSELEDT